MYCLASWESVLRLCSAMFCGGVFCSTGNICLGDGVCGVASEDSNTSTPVTTSSLMVGSGKPSPTAMGKPTGSTTTLASGTNIGAEATPATSSGTSRDLFFALLAISIAACALFP